MTIGEFKQWIIDNEVPDDADMLHGDSWPLSEAVYLKGLNEVELITI